MKISSPHLLWPILAFILSACAGGESGPSSKEISTPVGQSQGYEKASCAFSVSEGDVAQPVGAAQEILSHFGKFFDRARLTALGPASTQSTIGFIEQDGVALFQVPLAVKGCSNFGSLNRAPRYFENYWKDINSDGLLGLYFPENRARAGGLDQSLILVRPDTTRFTLVHEYLHALFDRARLARGVSDQELMQNLEQARRGKLIAGRLRAEDQDDRDKVIKVADAWIQEALWTTKASVHFALEEITIEAIMAQMTLDGHLQRVTDFDRLAGQGYILAKFEQIGEEYTRRAREVESILSALKGLGENSRLDQIQEVAQIMVSQLKEARSLAEKYASDVKLESPRKESFAVGIHRVDLPQSGIKPTKSCSRDF